MHDNMFLEKVSNKLYKMFSDCCYAMLMMMTGGPVNPFYLPRCCCWACY